MRNSLILSLSSKADIYSKWMPFIIWQTTIQKDAKQLISFSASSLGSRTPQWSPKQPSELRSEKLLNNGDDLEAMKNNIRHRDIFKKNENSRSKRIDANLWRTDRASLALLPKINVARGNGSHSLSSFKNKRIWWNRKKIEYIVYAKKEISNDSTHY